MPLTMPDPAALIANTELAYVSDYFSFVGSDAQGHVAFAIDTNRGRDGASYQADHLYAVLYDELLGWAPLTGIGRYSMTGDELLPIPNSPAFQFTGAPTSGVTIASQANQLSLAVEPLVERASLSESQRIFSLASAAATLTWKDRRIAGRVIYEYLVAPNLNMITRRSFKGLAEFQGLYLVAGEDDDVYIQRIGRGVLGRAPGAAFIGAGDPLLGFTVLGGQTEQARQVEFATPKHSLALGTYRWPQAWRVGWQGAQGIATLEARMVSRKTIGNWGLVGFSMAWVTGQLTYAGHSMPVVGLGELLMM